VRPFAPADETIRIVDHTAEALGQRHAGGQLVLCLMRMLDPTSAFCLTRGQNGAYRVERQRLIDNHHLALADVLTGVSVVTRGRRGICAVCASDFDGPALGTFPCPVLPGGCRLTEVGSNGTLGDQAKVQALRAEYCCTSTVDALSKALR
jgi:hypothetical protein